MAFPTLSKKPKAIVPVRVDNTIIAESEIGPPMTRRRGTRLRRRFRVEYSLLSLADIALLKAHEDTVCCDTSFPWYNCDDEATYTVKYAAPIEYPRTTENYNMIPVSFILVEV